MSSVIFGILGGIAVLCVLMAAYYLGRSDGIEEADRRRFWIDRGEQP